MFKNETWVTFLHIYRVTSVVTDSNFFLWFFNHDIGNCKIEKLMYFPTSEFLFTKVCKYSAHYASVKSLKPQLIASKIQGVPIQNLTKWTFCLLKIWSKLHFHLFKIAKILIWVVTVNFEIWTLNFKFCFGTPCTTTSQITISRH